MIRCAALLVLVAACGGDGDECVFGDPSLPPAIEIVYRTAGGELAEASDGVEIPLIRPVQGGAVLFAAARVTNVEGCTVQLSAALVDECNGRVVAIHERPVLLSDDGTGAGVPDRPALITNYAHVPACPTAAATRDIEGEPYTLRVSVEDAAGRTAGAEAEVVPVCAEPDFEQQCRCDCDADLGGGTCAAEPDAGMQLGCP